MCSALVDVHIDSIKVQLTCMVIARYCVIKWLDPFVSCSSHYFNGLELIFLVSLRCEYDCGWKCAKQPEFLSESGKKAGASHAKMIIFHLKTFPQRSSFFQYVTRPDVAERRRGPNAHSSRLTRSRCLAGETSYWLVFVFFSTFLFTSSTCLPCCGCCCAECLFSWSRSAATWPGKTGTCGNPLLSLIGPGSSEPMTAGHCCAVTLA